MNLIKNVDEDWKAAKGRVRQDLDTIQRNFNNLQAQFAALLKQVNTTVPTPPAVVSSANTVTTFDDDFLRSVAVVPLSGLTGKGTITDPLGLVLPITFVDISLTQSQLNGLSTTPVLAVTGVASKIIVPLAVLWRATNTAAFNLARSASLIYNVGGAVAIIASWPSSLNSPGAFSANAGIASPSALKSPDDAIGASVYIKGNADNTGGTSANTAICRVYYGVQG